MSDTKVKTINEGSDKFMIFIAIVLVVAGIVGYYFLPDLNTYLRIGVFVGGLVLAAVVLLLSSTGKRLVSFAAASFQELKRVAWPTRKETLQMTGVVFAFAIAMALFLWLVDKLLAWIIYGGILHWN